MDRRKIQRGMKGKEGSERSGRGILLREGEGGRLLGTPSVPLHYTDWLVIHTQVHTRARTHIQTSKQTEREVASCWK